MECDTVIDSNASIDEEAYLPRAYQIELEEKSIHQNTIIHLPTGSGKTFIAIQLIKRMKSQLRLPWRKGGKRTIFLVNNVPLVEQQKNQIQSFIPDSFRVVGYSSEDRVDFWNSVRWEEEIQKSHILVMTSQIFLDILLNSYITLQDTNLIIFDECHRAVEDHPMRQIMKQFEYCPLEEQPRVMGLTATLLNSNVANLSKVEEMVKKLETTFHASIASVSDSGEVLNYATNPKEVMLVYREPTASPVAAKVEYMFKELMSWIERVKLPGPGRATSLKIGQVDITHDLRKRNKIATNTLNDIINSFSMLGLYGASLSIIAHTIKMERLRGRCDNLQDSLFFKIIITELTRARALTEAAMSDVEGFEKVKKYSSDKVITLLKILKNYHPQHVNDKPTDINSFGKNLCAIIFVRERFSAKVIFNILKYVKKVNPKEYGFINPELVVGVNVNPNNDTREDLFVRKQTQSVVIRFRNNIINCVVSTSVLEEGIDIPQCSLIVRYDFPQEYRSYIQSKGRARNRQSCYVLMVPQSDEQKLCSKFRKFQQIEQHVDNLLNDEERQNPTSREIEKDLYSDEEIPPYILSSGAKITEISAISLLHRYCSLLPRDQFSILVPNWIMDKNTNSVSIIMPLICPIKEPIEGKPMKTLKAARRSAAMNACIQLHLNGLFLPGTLIPKPYAKVDFHAFEIRPLFPNWDYNDQPNTGTNKKVRRHKIMFPSCLKGPQPWTGTPQSFYLHIVDMDPAFRRPKDSRDLALFQLIEMEQGYGFITFHPLPRLCEFPLFLKVGEVTTNVIVNYRKIELNLQQFEEIKRFHFMLFNEVLGIAKKFNVYDDADYFMLVVPVVRNNCMDGNNKYTIDWQTMLTHKKIENIIQPTVQERKNIKVDVEKYKFSVVTPWYRGSHTLDRYIVSDVLEHQTPRSLIKDSKDTFITYYQSKYNLDLCGSLNQPLLEVKNITSRMNCLLPRASTLKSMSLSQRRVYDSAMDDRRELFQEIFVPELCILAQFPGVYWFKAIALPSVIHRVTMLLQAEELRVKISQFTGIGMERIPDDLSWQPITLDRDIAMDSILSVSNINPVEEITSVNRVNAGESLDEHQVFTMKDNLVNAKMAQLDRQYAWDVNQEPIDIERNICEVTLADIQCYDTFVNSPVDQTPSNLPSNSTKDNVERSCKPAILPPPKQFNTVIHMLSKSQSKLGIELKDVATALTVIGSNDVFNLERMETLGDSFLKYVTTIYLYHSYPKLNEGQLTNIKSKLLGNRNLYYAANAISLAGRMKIEQLSPRGDFLIPGFRAPRAICQQIETNNYQLSDLLSIELDKEAILNGRCDVRFTSDSKETVPQPAYQVYTGHVVVSDKKVADCVEALLGAYLESCGLKAAHSLLQFFQILPRENHSYEIFKRKQQTAYTMGKASLDEIELLLNDNRKDIEKILGYTFKDQSLLLEALSHSSYIRNRKTSSYERLEFLGDAILDFLITSYLYENYKTLKPGQLTDLRSALVNNVTFASYVVKLQLDKFFLSSLNPTLQQAMLRFQEYQQQRNFEITEDVLLLIDEEDCKMAEYVEVPKALSDIFESLAGAIYLDSGGDLSTVWEVYYKIMHAEIHRFAADVPIQPVRLLLENFHACPEFLKAQAVSKDIPVMMVPVKLLTSSGMTVVHGFGSNKAQARRAAAKVALKALGVCIA